MGRLTDWICTICWLTGIKDIYFRGRCCKCGRRVQYRFVFIPYFQNMGGFNNRLNNRLGRSKLNA